MAQDFPAGSSQPIMSLHNRSNFWKGPRGRKNKIWKGPDSQNRAHAHTGAQFSQCRIIPNKNRKVAKSRPKRDPWEGQKSTWRPHLPPSWWSGGASRHKYVPLRIHDAKKKQSRPLEDQQISPRHEKTQKNLPGKCPEVTQR